MVFPSNDAAKVKSTTLCPAWLLFRSFLVEFNNQFDTILNLLVWMMNRSRRAGRDELTRSMRQILRQLSGLGRPGFLRTQHPLSQMPGPVCRLDGRYFWHSNPLSGNSSELSIYTLLNPPNEFSLRRNIQSNRAPSCRLAPMNRRALLLVCAVLGAPQNRPGAAI